MLTKRFRASVVAGVVPLVLAVGNCVDTPTPTDAGAPPAPPRESSELPLWMPPEGDCRNQAPLSACDWVHGVEAVFLADVREVSFNFSNPCLYSEGEWIEDSEGLCTDIAPSLVLSVVVEMSIAGALQPGEQVQIAIGPGLYEDWSPKPVGDESVSWIENAPTSGNPIAIGDVIGFAVFHAEDDKWATLGEPLFMRGGDGALEFQLFGAATCQFRYPAGLSAVTADALSTDADSCIRSETAALYRRRGAAKLSGNGGCGHAAYGPQCRHSHPSSNGCTGDHDCEDGTVCAQGVCRAP